ncbi:MAG: lyase [Chloroflexi bacterium]|nr:lyase [Chloroflexota bacterium]
MTALQTSARVCLALGLLLLPAPGPTLSVSAQGTSPTLTLQEYPLPKGAYPHDAVPDRAGRWVWYSGQQSSTVGRLDPTNGELLIVDLPQRAAPHGIIIGPDDGVWMTDGGLNAITRLDPNTLELDVFPLPGPRANLNTLTFDHRGVVWFTGQGGYIGRLDPAVGVVDQWESPRGPGPYGIATAPDGTVWVASLAGSYLGRIDGDDGSMTVFDPPTPGAGVRRVWPDSQGRMWIAEYNVGQVGVYEPTTGQWKEWKLPGGDRSRAYAVYVDHLDKVWLSDTGTETIVRFDPVTETFATVAHGTPANIAQLGGVPGEIWGGQRQRDHLFVVRY